MTSERTRRRPVTRALPDVLQFMKLVWAVVHGLQTTSKRMSRVLGITGPQRLTLRVVGLRPGLSAGELAAILHLHPSTLTGILHRLAADGLLMRVPAVGDRRRAVLHLTPRGVRLNRLTGGTVEAAVSRALRDSSRADQRATTRLLERVADHLGPPRAPRRRARPGAGTRR